jgi:hypothetical protein
VACAATVVLTRLTFFTDNFGNFDVIGPVYNAEMILDGALPYRDTCEIKSPLLFYLFALVFWLFKPSLFYVRAVWGAWHLGACAVVYGIGSRLASRRVGAAGAFLLALFGALFDVNYASWLVLPTALAVYCYARGELGGRLVWFAAAGAFSALAFLVKKPGGFIAVALALLAVLSALSDHRERWMRVSIRRVATLAGGGLAGLATILIYFAWHGAFLDLFRGLFPNWVLKAVVLAKGNEGGTSLVLKSLVLGLVQMLILFPLPSMLAVFNVVVIVARRRAPGRLAQLALVCFAFSFLGVAATGGRFYPHHTIQYLPALVMLAVAPDAITWVLRWVREHASSSIHRLYVGSLAVIVAAGVGAQYRAIVVDKRHMYDIPAPLGRAEPQKVIGEAIRARTTPDDTVIAWGWFAWPIYHWSGRRSPSRIYKEMAFVTDVSTNTFWQKSRPMHFRPGPLADEYIRDVRRKRPSYIVVSDWYQAITGTAVDPLWEFDQLALYMKKHYRREGKYDRYVIYRRKDVAPLLDSL